MAKLSETTIDEMAIDEVANNEITIKEIEKNEMSEMTTKKAISYKGTFPRLTKRSL